MLHLQRGEKVANAERKEASGFSIPEHKEQVIAKIEAGFVDQSRMVVAAASDAGQVEKPKEIALLPKEKAVKKKPDKQTMSTGAEIFMASLFIGILGLVGLGVVGQLIFLPFIVGRAYRDIDRLGVMSSLGRFAFWLGKISALLKALHLGSPLLLTLFPVLATVSAPFMGFALCALMVGSYLLGRHTKPELELSNLLPSVESVGRYIFGAKKRTGVPTADTKPQ